MNAGTLFIRSIIHLAIQVQNIITMLVTNILSVVLWLQITVGATSR